MQFGEKLRQYRMEHHMSQEELALILGTSKQVISRYESDQRSPKIETVQEYAQKLSLPVFYLVDDKFSSAAEAAASISKSTSANTIHIAGRDGSFTERKLTDDQIELIRRMIDQMPDFKD